MFKVNAKNTILVLVILYIFLWSIQLPVLGVLFFILFICLFFSIHLFPDKLLTFFSNTKFHWLFIAYISSLFLIFTYLFPRNISWDGHLWYLKHTLFLTRDFYPELLEFPLQPFLAELFFGFLTKYMSLQMVSLAIGVFTLSSMLLSAKLLRILGATKDVALTVLFILFASPISLFLALLEYKVDMLLLLLALCVYIAFFYAIKSNKIRYYLGLGVFCALATLCKLTFLPLALVLLFVVVFDAIFNQKSIYNWSVLRALTSTFVFLCIILGWVAYFGVSIPWSTFFVLPVNQTPQISLTRDVSLYTQCLADVKTHDFNQYFFDTNIRQRLLQPIYNLLWIYPDMKMHSFNMIQPGPFLYLSIWLLPVFAYMNRKDFYGRNNRVNLYFLIMTFTFVIFFYITVGTLYWYVLPIFPFTVFYMVKTFYNKTTLLLKKLFISIVLAVGFTYLVVISSLIIKMLTDPLYGLGLAISSTQVSNVLNKLDKNFYIMDTTPHPYNLFTAYVDNYDARVVRDNYYFYTSKLTPQEMYNELVRNNIRYIAYYDFRAGISTIAFDYSGCTRSNQHMLEGFLNTYGMQLYYLDNFGSIYALW